MDINEFMAVEVMGWHIDGKEAGRLGEPYYIKLDVDKVIDIMPVKDWHPAEDLNQAMRCAKKLSKDNTWRVEIDIVPHGFAVNIVEKTYGESYLSSRFGADLPLAICEAIKEAMEVDDE